MTAESEKKRMGRPPGPVSEKRVQAAIALLKRSDLSGEEIAAHFLPDPAPEEKPEASQDPRPGVPILVEIAPLEDGVNPVELLVYLPDAIKACSKELAGIRSALQDLTKEVRGKAE